MNSDTAKYFILLMLVLPLDIWFDIKDLICWKVVNRNTQEGLDWSNKKCDF